MKKEVYQYTSNMPSKNPFIWYFDDKQSVAFGTSEEAKYWKKRPEKGDLITYWKSGNYNQITERVFINQEMVFERNEEQEQLKEKNEKKKLEALIIETKNRLSLKS